MATLRGGCGKVGAFFQSGMEPNVDGDIRRAGRWKHSSETGVLE